MSELVNLHDAYRGVPTFVVDAPLGSVHLFDTHRVMLGEGVFNPDGSEISSGYRPALNLVLTTFAARGLIEFLKTLPGVSENEK